LRQIVSQVFRFGVASGLMESDPTRDLKGAVKAPAERNFPSPKDPKRIGEILRLIEGYTGEFVTRAALRLAPLLLVRPGELRRMEWAELDLEAGIWTLPAEKMKMRRPHLVPLARQAVAILRTLEPVTGGGRYVFRTGWREAPLSDMTLLRAFRRLGIPKDELVTHGWRSVGSTLLNELGFNPDAIERQLAHVESNSTRRAYNKAEHWEERVRMMQFWANHMDRLREAPEEAGKIAPIRSRTAV